MRKAYLLSVFLLIGNLLLAQKTCENVENPIKDLNSINKCLVEKKLTAKQTRAITIKNNADFKSRFLTIRKKTEVSSISEGMNTKGLEKTVNATSKLESLNSIEKKYINTIEDITVVDEVPVFRKCRKLSENKLQRKCFNEEMMSFINKNLKYPKEVVDGNVLGKLAVQFVIDVDGKTNNIKATGSNNMKDLKEIVIEMVSRLPKFSPAKKDDKAVPVAYEFLLNFSK